MHILFLSNYPIKIIGTTLHPPTHRTPTISLAWESEEPGSQKGLWSITSITPNYNANRKP